MALRALREPPNRPGTRSTKPWGAGRFLDGKFGCTHAWAMRGRGFSGASGRLRRARLRQHNGCGPPARAAFCGVICDVTPAEHPSLRVSSAVTCCQAVRAQTRGIASVSRHLRLLASLAVTFTCRTVTAEAAGSSPVVPAIPFKHLQRTPEKARVRLGPISAAYRIRGF